MVFLWFLHIFALTPSSFIIKLPKTAQDGPGGLQESPKTPQEGPRRPQDGPRQPRDGPAGAQAGSKSSPRRTRMRPSWPRTAQRRPQRQAVQEVLAQFGALPDGSTSPAPPRASSERLRGRSPRVSPSLYYNAAASACEKGLGAKGPPWAVREVLRAPGALRDPFEAPQMAPRRPRTAPRRFRDAQECAPTAQEDPERAPARPQSARRQARSLPRRPRRPPRRPKKRPQTASKRAPRNQNRQNL